MDKKQPKPFQFGLAGIFGLTTAAAAAVWIGPYALILVVLCTTGLTALMALATFIWTDPS